MYTTTSQGIFVDLHHAKRTAFREFCFLFDDVKISKQSFEKSRPLKSVKCCIELAQLQILSEM